MRITPNSVAIAIVSAPSAADIGLSGMPVSQRISEAQPVASTVGTSGTRARRERAVDGEQDERDREQAGQGQPVAAGGEIAEADSAAITGRPASWTSTPAGGPPRSPGSPISSADAVDQRLLVLERLGADAEGEQRLVAQLARSPGRSGRPGAGRRARARASVASIPRRVGVAPPRVRKSESAGPGQMSASRQLGFSPPRSRSARSTRCLKSAIQAIVAGSARSGASMLTSSSPETPVASCSSFRSLTAARPWGASERTSEMVSIWVPRPQPTSARADHPEDSGWVVEG